MFWWLYHAQSLTSNGFVRKTDSDKYPLIIWLQGGPGASSTGFGNFEEIGPLDSNRNVRKDTWAQHANLLFIDNPVGTGFSYVTSDDAYATDNNIIGEDLVILLKHFFKSNPKLQVSFYSLYIISNDNHRFINRIVPYIYSLNHMEAKWQYHSLFIFGKRYKRIRFNAILKE